MIAPLKTIYVTTKFGVSGSQWQFNRHMGVDLRASVGTPLYAPEAGKINERYIGSNGIKVLGLAGAKWHRFLHLNDFMVGVGDTVKAGQLIGHTGNTGGVAAHLHWDVRKPNTAWSASFSNYYNPINLITEEKEEMPNEKNVRDWFAKYRFKAPTANQIAKYTTPHSTGHSGWRLLATDVANALLSDYKKAKAAGPESNDQALKDSLFSKIKTIFGK